jgi:predicted ATPase/class 3 adenylate cyclase
VAELPSGTVTFLFTDIEGSTRLLHELGDAYADVLAEHRRVLREAFSRNGGVEVDTQGDAFFVAFARASDALAAAHDAQLALDGPIRVRVGIHTGEPLVTGEGYVGIDVHRAARIAAVGHGGQVLVSQSTRDLVGADSLRDLGEHRLKDLTAPERIFQLGDGDFPPLRSLNATNLPVASNPLVGRQRELREIAALLSASARLVTLTGPGGTGKTRLALQVAADLVDQFSGGVFFVPLAGVQDPELLPATVTSTIGIHRLDELRDREALLLLDNFEHLLDAASTVADVLRSASRAKVLATSRAPLRVEGEREYPVDPLPDGDALVLLTERARAVRPDFKPDDTTQAICRRLDGLPLALELAAPRLRSLGSAALLERLEQRLPLLTSGRRDSPERQRTLRATIEWSYDLLDVHLQEMYARLGVFATFTLEGAEAVAGATLDDIDALVEASLLKPVRGDRFLMLETIREFALERLNAAEGSEDVRRRHAEYVAELGERANLTIESEGPMRHRLVASEQNNIRTALSWAIETGNGELGLRIATALENYWMTSDPFEARRWFQALLPLAPDPPSHLHALALRCLGNSAAIDVADEAEDLYEQSLQEVRELGDERRVAVLLQRVAVQALRKGDRERARRLADESLALLRRTGFTKPQAVCFSIVGDLARLAGENERALELYQQGVEVARETGFRWFEKHALLAQALSYFELGRPADAEECSRASLAAARAMDDRIGLIDGLAFLARAAADLGKVERAGWLWGAIEAEVERAPVAGWEYERERTEPYILGHSGPEWDEALAAGHRLTLDGAVALALESSNA